MSGDAPAQFSSSSCEINHSAQICTYSGGTLTCDPDVGACDAGVSIFAVKYTSNPREISVFGECLVNSSPVTFCCLTDDVQTEISDLELFGTESSDERIDFTLTEGSNTFDLSPTGTKLAARALGRDGNDGIHGSNFDDPAAYTESLYGEDGEDTIHGNDGNDGLYGGNDDDTLSGGAGNDVIRGGNSGSTGDDLFGGTGDDFLYGEGGRDVMWGEKGKDTMFGGPGNDDLHGGPDDDTLWGNTNDDKLFGDDGDDHLFGQNGNDELQGGAGDDHLHGSNGADLLQGEDGDDVIYGGAGQDVLDGGDDDDLLCETHQGWQSPGPFCPASNSFYGGGGEDTAFLSNGYSTGGQWCGSMLQIGTSIEIAAQSGRDWTSNMNPVPPTITDFATPQECADLITLGGS